VEESGPLDGLPAAVEVAAYRIVVEALNNVNRHAGATRCRVVLALAEQLVLEVHDDGVGLPPGLVPGIGLASIRERTQELGGSWSVGASDAGGVAIRVSLPVELCEELAS
jgi:signal transduction histidine kinase